MGAFLAKKTLIINYKAYREGLDKGMEIAMVASAVSKELGVDTIVAVPFTLCRGAAKITKAIAQGIDPVEPGAFTGHITWYEIAKSGCVGTLINHSENRMTPGKIEKAIRICKDNSLLSYVCVAEVEEAKRVAGLNPTAVSYESPSLIGGDVSVSSAEPGVVEEFVNAVHKNSESIALVGAGIKTVDDVRKSVELGADGILVSSGIIKADFKKGIEELALALVG